MATSTPGGPQTNLGLAPNVAGLLCYVPCCVGLVFGIVAAIVEKQSRFVRFHAFQSLLLHAALIVISVGYQVLHLVVSATMGVVGIVMFPIGLLLGLGCLGVLVLMMIKANGNEEYELPVIGKMARQWV